MSAFVVGSTGLCGAFILKLADQYYDKVYSLSRSKPLTSNDAKHEILLSDSDNWIKLIDDLEIDNPNTFFSGLGTTRGKAGGIANQYKIDHDLNLELAKAAKRKGFKQYVLISSVGANKSSNFAYMQMKGQLEDDVIELGFEKTIILRPGFLVGERHESKGFLNGLGASFGSLIHGTSMAKYMGSPISGEEVAIAALKLSKKESEEKVVIVSGYDLNEVAKN